MGFEGLGRGTDYLKTKIRTDIKRYLDKEEKNGLEYVSIPKDDFNENDLLPYQKGFVLCNGMVAIIDSRKFRSRIVKDENQVRLKKDLLPIYRDHNEWHEIAAPENGYDFLFIRKREKPLEESMLSVEDGLQADPG